jgi:hypothetical protein
VELAKRAALLYPFRHRPHPALARGLGGRRGAAIRDELEPGAGDAIAREVAEVLTEKGYKVLVQDYNIPLGASFIEACTKS